jgi:hypothetical protein
VNHEELSNSDNTEKGNLIKVKKAMIILTMLMSRHKKTLVQKEL